MGLFRKRKKSFTVTTKMKPAQKASRSQSSLVDASLNMTGAGIFTMVLRVVVIRHFGGLLCAVGPMVSLYNLSSLHPRES